MPSMTDTDDRWTPSQADRRVVDDLEAAGIRVGGGRRRSDWSLPLPELDEPVPYELNTVRDWLGL